MRYSFYSMPSRFQEPVFAVILLISTGIALAAHMLGVLLDLVPSILISIALVGIGVAFFIPAGEREINAILGTLVVCIAGFGLPRLVAEVTTTRDEVRVILALGGIVLLLTIIALRLTDFRRRPLHPSSH